MSRSPTELNRSRSSSSELEVDSPPPPSISLLRNARLSVSESPTIDLISTSPTKKSSGFSVSALLQQDNHQPRTVPKSPVPASSFETFRTNYPSNYEHQAILHRQLFPPLPWLAAFAFHQGQQPGAHGYEYLALSYLLRI